MSVNRRAALAIALTLLAAPAAGAQSPAPAGRLDETVRPRAYALTFHLDPEAERFEGSGRIEVSLARPLERFWIHARDLRIEHAELVDATGQSIPAKVRQEGPTGISQVVLERTAAAGAARLELAWTGAYQTQPTGLYRTRRDGKSYLVTQFEPISARRAFPSFDQPGFKTPFEVTIEAPAGDVVAANAPIAAEEVLPGGWTRTRFAPTAPLPTYLVALAVGPYDVVEGQTVGKTPLRALTAAGRGEEARWGLEKAAQLTPWLEDYFGGPMPYPKLDLIGALDFAGGGMENAGAIVYNEVRLLTAPDASVDRRRRALTLHAHEIAHQWFGDLVTPAWWDDLWLNESFATWMQYKAAGAIWPQGEFDRGAQQAGFAGMGIDSLASTRRLREPIAGDASIADAFDAITYLKGAGVLAMFERFVGVDTFRQGVRLHLSRHPHGVARADDFFEAMAAASGQPQLAEAFRSFVDEPGVPYLRARLEHRIGARPILHLSQTRYRPLGSPLAAQTGRWTIPICLKVYGQAGPGSVCTLMTGPEHSVELPMDDRGLTVMPNADGVGYYRFSLDETGWKSLFARAGALPAGEALAAVDSLVAGYRAGEVSASLLITGLSAFASHPAWDVAGQTMDAFDNLIQRLPASEAAHARLRVASLYRTRFAAPDALDDVGASLLRSDLDEVMVLTARDRFARGVFAEQGRRALAGGEVVAQRRELALTAALLEGAPSTFDDLLARARARDGDAVAALARAEQPEQVRTLLRLLEEGTFDTTQTSQLLDGFMSRTESRAVAWPWVEANAERLLELTPESSRGRRLAQLGRWFCTPAEKARFNALIAAKASQMPGYERSLAQSNEAIDVCIAVDQKQGAALRAALR